jgi:hypothetical protein
MSSNAENELLELAAKMHGFSSVTQYLMWKAAPDSLMRDLMADGRRGISNSASMLPPQPTKPVTRGTGWVEPAPVRQPPGAEPGGLIDQMCEAEAQREKAEKIAKINMQAYEEQRAFEQELRRRDKEMDPTGQLYGPYDDDDK